MKEVIKMVCMITIIVEYFLNFIFMFLFNPLDILISEIAIWLLLILMLLGIAFVNWLND